MIKKAFEICIEMLTQRGFHIHDYDNERILAGKGEDDRICAFLSETSKLNVDMIQEIMGMLNEMKVKHGILIFNDNPTPVARKIIEENKDMEIEVFHMDELQYNITKHVLVPRHEIAFENNTPDCKEFKLKYGADKYPIISKSDPVTRFYNFHRGDIIRVYRKNGFITYRIVK